MKTSIYKQSEYGKLNTNDLLFVINSLEPGEDAAQYIYLLAEQFVKLMKDLGASSFGIEQAKEVIGSMIFHKYFVPLKDVP